MPCGLAVTPFSKKPEVFLSASVLPCPQLMDDPPLTSGTPGAAPPLEIGQIAVTVGSVAKAAIFYRDVIGLKFLFNAPPDLAFLAAGSVRLMLTTQGGEVGKNSVLYFKVGELDRAYAATVARGAAGAHTPRLIAKMPDHELWIGFVRDPDGNLIGLMEEKR
jgi:methylmalonyl-CoA/ethylmalonyl-CoA epimerase